MRWHILRTLVVKEAHRHLADRGGLFLAVLLVAATLLISFFGKPDSPAESSLGGIQLWCIDYWDKDSPWVHFLRSHPPPRLKVRFRWAKTLATDREGNILYRRSMAAVQIRPNGYEKNGRPRYLVWFWYPAKDRNVLDPFVRWFWKESLGYFQNTPIEIETSDDQIVFPDGTASIQIRPAGTGPNVGGTYKLLLWRCQGAEVGPPPEAVIEEKWSALAGAEEVSLMGFSLERPTVTTILVIFSLFLFCVYLLPSFTCEEHERGVLLAQALSPASPVEVLTAKFLFYPAIAIGLAALLTGMWSPAVLARPFFWLALVTTTAGYLGVGMTIASLARTQRAASMGALCYLLAASLLLFLTERFGVPSARFVALEYYCPRTLEAVINGPLTRGDFLNLAGAMMLSCFWLAIATWLFRKRGWQ